MKHLRFPFSFFLMPVFLFALSQADTIQWNTTLLGFFILHLLIFPSSNGYNSYQDKDETSIGGLKHPPKVTKQLFYVTLTMDILGVVLSLFVSAFFALCVTIFILISRAYSYRGIRLKRSPFIAFLTVFIFQGGFVYMMSSAAIYPSSFSNFFSPGNIICMIVASLFMGSVYPLTQIYQHEADLKDGVISISYKLGYTGTFIFSAVLFAMASFILLYYFIEDDKLTTSILFIIVMIPGVYQLSMWFNKVRRNTINADYENTMRMNVLTSTSMNLFFIVLTLNNYLAWFR